MGPFVYPPEESVVFGCNFIVEKHMYRSALAIEKYFEQGFEPSFTFRNFEILVVRFIYREWSYRHRSERSVNEVELRKMLAILKADQGTHTEREKPFQSPWQVSHYMYSQYVLDLRQFRHESLYHCNDVES